MASIDEVSEAIGSLRTVCETTKDAVDIIRGDQISLRREVEWLKTSVKNLNTYEPAMKDVQAVKKVGSVTVKGAMALGSAGLLGTIWLWLKSHVH